MSGGSPAPIAALSFDDKVPQATDSISMRTPGCVRSNSAAISFKTATAFGSIAVCQMRIVVCCSWCARRTDHDRQGEKKHETSSYHDSLAGFASHVPPPRLCFSKSAIWEIYLLTQLSRILISANATCKLTRLCRNESGTNIYHCPTPVPVSSHVESRRG